MCKITINFDYMLIDDSVLYEVALLLYEISHLNPFVSNLIMVFPILRSNPDLDIGTPVARLMSCLTFVIPNARFHEKLRPGMGDDFFPIVILFQILIMFGTVLIYALSESCQTFLMQLCCFYCHHPNLPTQSISRFDGCSHEQWHS